MIRATKKYELINQLEKEFSLHDDIEMLKEFTETWTYSKTIKKNEIICDIGETCNNIYFLISGMAISFNKYESINYFRTGKEFFTSGYSYLTSKPSIEKIIVTRGSIIASTDRTNLQSFYAKNSKFNSLGERIFRVMCDDNLKKKIYHFNCDTNSKYFEFAKNNPNISDRMISKYLNIRHETISRLKK